jgi:hypothetical protein
MSFVYGTNTELIYSMPATGANASAPGGASVILSGNTTTNPACLLPALNNIWPMAAIVGKAMKVVARGTYGTPASAPGTWVIGCGLNTAQATKPAATVLAATGAFTPTATLIGLSVTNGEWELEFDIVVQTAGTNAGAAPNANIITGGLLTMGTGNNAATAAATCFAVGSASAISVNPSASYYLEVYATFSTGPSSTQLQCNQLFVFGLN